VSNFRYERSAKPRPLTFVVLSGVVELVHPSELTFSVAEYVG
jgi:hypothetical protein